MDAVMVRRGTIDFLHGCFGFLSAPLAVDVARSFWEEQDSAPKDRNPDEANADRQTPGNWTAALMLVGAEIDARGQEDTEGDEELVGADQSTTNVTWASFG